jgi:membrane protein DedA with SNARE-associated domain
MEGLLKHITDVLLAFGPVGIFLIAFIDSLGVPLPAALDFLLIGFAAHTPSLAYVAATAATIGSLGGNFALFRAARYGGDRFARLEAPEGRARKFRLWFHRYGLLTVFIPSVTPVVPLPLKVFVVSAGAMHTPLRRFLAVLFAARVIRYFGEAYLGVRLGLDARGFLTHNAWNIAGLFLALALALIAFIKWTDRRRVEA